jgi:hypothetical protein
MTRSLNCSVKMKMTAIDTCVLLATLLCGLAGASTSPSRATCNGDTTVVGNFESERFLLTVCSDCGTTLFDKGTFASSMATPAAAGTSVPFAEFYNIVGDNRSENLQGCVGASLVNRGASSAWLRIVLAHG